MRSKDLWQGGADDAKRGGAGSGNRTHVSSLGSSRTTIVLYPRDTELIQQIGVRIAMRFLRERVGGWCRRWDLNPHIFEDTGF